MSTLTYLRIRRVAPGFFNKVDFFGPLVAGMESRCWTWVASTDRKGYGKFRGTGAHREAFKLLVGPIPFGTIDHLCRTRNCVNPSHMEIVSNRENILRGNGVGVRNSRKTHCQKGHPLSGDNLYVEPSGKRICRTCRRASNRSWNASYKHWRT